MGLSLWTVLQAVLLFTNAFAILNEERFLKKREYATSEALGVPLLRLWHTLGERGRSECSRSSDEN